MFCKKWAGAFFCITAAVSMAFNSASFPVAAADSEDMTEQATAAEQSMISYEEYLSRFSGEGSDLPDTAAAVQKKEDGSIICDADIKKTGLYCIQVSYLSGEKSPSSAVFSLSIDGEVPFDSAERLRLDMAYESSSPAGTDENGDEIRPRRTIAEKELSCDIKDPDGLYSGPLVFYFEKGRHTFKLDFQKGSLEEASVLLHGISEYKTYDEYKSSVNASVTLENANNALVRIEGEDAAYSSDLVLAPSYDNSSCDVSPADPWHILYNTIGKNSWKKSGQTITWRFSVPEDGWYKIGIKARQEEMRGFFSNRRIYIDGEVPCAEMSEVRFDYSTEFELTEVRQKDGGELYVYLASGEEHTLAMEAVPGAIGSYIRQIQDITARLNSIYCSIVMITGTEPDKYTDYYVHEQIPGLTEDLAEIAGELRNIQRETETLAGSEGSEAASLERLAAVLEKCASSPVRIPENLSNIKDNTAAVLSWCCECRDQPLEIDYIELASKNSEFSSIRAGFFERLSYGFKRFLSSFSDEKEDEEGIEVWIQLGRDQAQTVETLAKSEFTPQYGVPVSVKLVSGGILESALAGKGPDAALFIGGETPVNLGSRGLLADISELDGFDEAAENYTNNALVPYTYNGSVYGLPLTRNWAVMFCRMDILGACGFSEPPETWQQLRDMLPELQRNYMSAGLVLPGITGNNQIMPYTETGHTFAALMLQRGLNYYNDTLTATTFDTKEAADAFEEWTDFYTKYNLAQQYDPFSRFRTGEYPIVIADYTLMNQLSSAAPEINGLWKIAPIPGTEREDGTVSHSVNSVGTGAVVFKNGDSQKLQSAWEFVKWFCSAEVQMEYAQFSEGLMGRMGRYTPADMTVLEQLDWSKDELETLEISAAEIREIPVIPASYAVTRNIMNAFRETVDSRENARDTFLWYNRDINAEIKRKQENMENNK